jgi:hypothetical protein
MAPTLGLCTHNHCAQLTDFVVKQHDVEGGARVQNAWRPGVAAHLAPEAFWAGHWGLLALTRGNVATDPTAAWAGNALIRPESAPSNSNLNPGGLVFRPSQELEDDSGTVGQMTGVFGAKSATVSLVCSPLLTLPP